MLTTLIAYKMNIKNTAQFISLPVLTVPIWEVNALKIEPDTHYDDFTSRMHLQVYTLQRIVSRTLGLNSGKIKCFTKISYYLENLPKPDSEL